MKQGVKIRRGNKEKPQFEGLGTKQLHNTCLCSSFCERAYSDAAKAVKPLRKEK
jgi:hypothetical protein